MKIIYYMAALSVVFACFLSIASATPDSLNNVLFNGDYEFIDLSYPFDSQTIYWPDSQDFKFTRKTEGYNRDGFWYASFDFTAGEHGGTHIDAPYHFAEFGQHVGDIPLEKLIVPLIIVDISSKVNDNPNFILHKQDLDYMLNNNMGKPCLIIFNFGWSKFYKEKNKYLGVNNINKTLNFPGLSGEIAEWITSNYKNVVGVGVDVASVDPGSSTDVPVHKILCGAGLYSIENVNLGKSVPDYGCTALVLPMKIKMGTGAPLRLVAICPKQKPIKF